jgi:hypothetical protein
MDLFDAFAVAPLLAGSLDYLTAFTKMEIVIVPRRKKTIVLIQLVESSALVFSWLYPLFAALPVLKNFSSRCANIICGNELKNRVSICRLNQFAFFYTFSHLRN